VNENVSKLTRIMCIGTKNMSNEVTVLRNKQCEFSELGKVAVGKNRWKG
jgi:hypothetical protein